MPLPAGFVVFGEPFPANAMVHAGTPADVGVTKEDVLAVFL